MGTNTIIRRRSRKIGALLGATMLLTTLCGVMGREVRADSQTLVIQGRITGIQGALVTVKTPDGFPGGPGGHAQFVIAGPSFRVDVSRARVLSPDGEHADKLPLAVGDRVLMVLSGPDSGPPAPGSPHNVNQTYVASIIERIAQSDTIITH